MHKLLLLLSIAAGLTAQAADWKIAIEPKAPLKSVTSVPIEVTVTDAAGKPVEGATVDVVLTMVEMDHGETHNQAKASKPGVYEARAHFMMSGKWNIEAKVKKGGDTASSKQQVDVKD